MQRADLAALDLNRFLCPEVVVFNPSFVKAVTAFKDNECLYLVETLKAYELKYTGFPADKGENSLFHFYTGQNKGVSYSTIRWLKSCLQNARVNTQAFQAHSTQAVTSIKAPTSGVIVEDFLKADDWSTKDTFHSIIS